MLPTCADARRKLNLLCQLCELCQQETDVTLNKFKFALKSNKKNLNWVETEVSHRCKPYEDLFSFNRFPMVGFLWWVSKVNATGFFFFFFFSIEFFFTLYFLLLYFERAFVNLYILSFMKAHRVQRNFSEGKRPKRANSLNVNARIFYLFLLYKRGNWFEIHCIICTWVVVKKAVSYSLKSKRTSEI